MRCIILGTGLLLALAPALASGDDKQDLSPADETRKLITDFDKATDDFNKEVRAAKTEDERRNFIFEKRPKPDKTAARLLELAEKNPKDTGVVPEALIWAITHSSSRGEQAKTRERALDQLTNHVDSPKVGDICLSLIREPSPSGEKLMRAIAEKSANEEAKGKATFSLGQYLKNTAASIQTLKDQTEMLKSQEQVYGKEVVASMLERAPTALIKESEKLFETVADKYGYIKVDNQRLGEKAEGELFEIRNLAIGKVAPDIEAEDLYGTTFKLSDYRGKVVVLNFWGNWCGPCRDMYDQERSLVKKLADRPFVMIGVNSDINLQDTKRVMEKEKITWRSFWNGGPRGPISTKWNVRSWPTIFVLDAKGVIRYKNVLGEKMNEAVEVLLKEQEGDGK